MLQHVAVHEWFSDKAVQFGGRIALDGDGQRVTYAELEAESNRVANTLAALDAPRESIVALAVSNPGETVTGILGCLKAGCAFAALDPRFPARRLDAMLSRSAPRFVVASPELIPLVIERCGACGLRPEILTRARPLYLEAPAFRIHEFSRETVFQGEASSPDSLCSVYFTSGSTGTPKAIAGRLKGIAHFVDWEIQHLGVSERDRISQLTPPIFDGFLKDVFVPLCAGGTACIPPSRDLILNAPALASWIDEARLTVLHCVPSVFRGLLREDLKPSHFPQLRIVVLAGEEVLPSDVAGWRRVFGDRIQLLNLYGPTETSLTKVYHFISAKDCERQVIPIGQCMNGAELLILDEAGSPCPPGAIGEIAIQTEYASLGYLNDPEATAERFLPHPAGIIYRTGDFGLQGHDGLYEFHGRKDGQVKIHGVRIEVGEIERRIAERLCGGTAAVIVAPGPDGAQQLRAYVVAGEAVTAEALRAHLAESLPPSMLPCSFTFLDALPLTTNGKLDRLALPRLSERRGPAVEAPRAGVEQDVWTIWSDILKKRDLRVDENFFTVGGHSLLAMRVLARVHRQFGVEVPLGRFLSGPTIAKLAGAVDELLLASVGEEEMNDVGFDTAAAE